MMIPPKSIASLISSGIGVAKLSIHDKIVNSIPIRARSIDKNPKTKSIYPINVR